MCYLHITSHSPSLFASLYLHTFSSTQGFGQNSQRTTETRLRRHLPAAELAKRDPTISSVSSTVLSVSLSGLPGVWPRHAVRCSPSLSVYHRNLFPFSCINFSSFLQGKPWLRLSRWRTADAADECAAHRLGLSIFLMHVLLEMWLISHGVQKWANTCIWTVLYLEL